MKLLFYLIILAIWVISNLKKQGHWEEKIPDFPEDSSPAPAKIPPKEEPAEEGYFPNTPKNLPEKPAEETSVSYDEKLAIRREKLQALKTQLADLKKEAPLVSAGETANNIKPTSQLYFFEEEKPSSLQSGIKEGIIWSIILGPPRSKLRFDGKNPPLQR